MTRIERSVARTLSVLLARRGRMTRVPRFAPFDFDTVGYFIADALTFASFKTEQAHGNVSTDSVWRAFAIRQAQCKLKVLNRKWQCLYRAAVAYSTQGVQHRGRPAHNNIGILSRSMRVRGGLSYGA